MKTTIQRRGWFRLAALLILMSFVPALSKAQCPNNLINTLGCQVDVKVEIYNRVPPAICGPAPCASYPLSVPPGGVMPFMCPCGPVCNVRVIVVAIGGVPVGPAVADFSSLPPGVAIPVPPPPGIPCLPAGPGPFIHYNGIDFVITP